MQRVISLVGIAILCLAPLEARADMSSSNYQIYSDSVGFDNGVADASSTSYAMTATVGDLAAGSTASATYTIDGGFQSAANSDETLSVALSGSTAALGELSASAVSAAAIVVTVSTNATQGYALSITNVSGSMPAAVGDGAVTAGSEEYGVAVSGANRVFSDDRSVIVGRTLVNAASAVTSDASTITFKASMSSNSTAGTYTQTVTITAAANL